MKTVKTVKTGKTVKTDISVIIPVLHEPRTINQTIKALCQQHFSGSIQVIVVDGSHDQDTIAVIEKGKNVWKNRRGNSVEIILVSSSPGRGCQMNKGAKTASSDLLLFLHSDTVLPEKGLQIALKVMDDPKVASGAFDLSIDSPGFFFRVIEKTASLRSRMTKIPYGDQAIFFRRSAFFVLGAYREIPIMEDVDLMLRLKKSRGKIRFIRTPISTSPRRWEKEGRLYCTLRNWVLVSLFYLGVSPQTLAAFYQNHTKGRRNS